MESSEEGWVWVLPRQERWGWILSQDSFPLLIAPFGWGCNQVHWGKWAGFRSTRGRRSCHVRVDGLSCNFSMWCLYVVCLKCLKKKYLRVYPEMPKKQIIFFFLIKKLKLKNLFFFLIFQHGRRHSNVKRRTRQTPITPQPRESSYGAFGLKWGAPSGLHCPSKDNRRSSGEISLNTMLLRDLEMLKSPSRWRLRQKEVFDRTRQAFHVRSGPKGRWEIRQIRFPCVPLLERECLDYVLNNPPDVVAGWDAFSQLCHGPVRFVMLWFLCNVCNA